MDSVARSGPAQAAPGPVGASGWRILYRSTGGRADLIWTSGSKSPQRTALRSCAAGTPPRARHGSDDASSPGPPFRGLEFPRIVRQGDDPDPRAWWRSQPAEAPPRPCPRKLRNSIQQDFQRTHRTGPDRAGTTGLEPGILSTSRTEPDFTDGCQGPLNPQVPGSSPGGRTPETPVLATKLPGTGVSS